MGRNKSYDVHAVVTALTHVFWQKGYQATSITDLEQASGLNRKSLFHEFGSKEELFSRVLEHYLDIKAKPDGLPLGRQPFAVDNIRRFFRAIRYREENELGCLMVLTILEQESVPPFARELACALYARLEEAFFTNLAPAVKRRQLTRSKARDLAKFLVNALYGIIVAGRAGATNAELKRIVKIVLSTLPASAT